MENNRLIRLSTTTSVMDSGILPFMIPLFERDTGYHVTVDSAGSGGAIEKGKHGDADLLIVHSPKEEAGFIVEGYSGRHESFMYNYFVIAGPKDDPAGIRGSNNAVEALQKIAHTGNTFISRGDFSGTNNAEQDLWKSAGIEPDGKDWYVVSGKGMGDSLSEAAEQQAYILTDKATYLSHPLKNRLAILISDSEELKNQYSLLSVNPDKWPETNTEGSDAFIQWVKSNKGKSLIENFGKNEYGEQLFHLIQ